MSVFKTATVWCNAVVATEGRRFTGCDQRVEDTTATDARAVAKAKGWDVNRPGGQDYCPRHRRKSRET